MLTFQVTTRMSRIPLGTVIESLEKEFEEAETSYFSEETAAEEASCISESTYESQPLDDSLEVGQPLLKSTVLEEEASFDDVPLDSSFGRQINTDVALELSDEDKKEQGTVDEFMEKTCGCKFGPDSHLVAPNSSKRWLRIIALTASNCRGWN